MQCHVSIFYMHTRYNCIINNSTAVLDTTGITYTFYEGEKGPCTFCVTFHRPCAYSYIPGRRHGKHAELRNMRMYQRRGITSYLVPGIDLILFKSALCWLGTILRSWLRHVPRFPPIEHSSSTHTSTSISTQGTPFRFDSGQVAHFGPKSDDFLRAQNLTTWAIRF